MSKKKKKSKFSRKFQKKIRAKKGGKLEVSDSRKQLMQKVKDRVASEGREIEIETSNPQKMSEIIIDYAEPLLEISTTDKEQEKAVIMAITFWNLAILKENERQDMMDSLTPHLLQGGDPEDLNQTIEYFIERKQILYPDVNRMILDYDCVHTMDRLHLNVVSNNLE